MFGRRKTHELAVEIAAHLQLETDRLREQGLTDDEARAAALRNFGNVTRVREQHYESGAWGVLDRLTQDVRFGARSGEDSRLDGGGCAHAGARHWRQRRRL